MTAPHPDLTEPGGHRSITRPRLAMAGICGLMPGTSPRPPVRKFQTGLWSVIGAGLIVVAVVSAVRGEWIAAVVLLAFGAGMLHTGIRIWRDNQPHSFLTSLVTPRSDDMDR